MEISNGGRMELGSHKFVGLSLSQVDAVFNLFKEREKQEKMSGKSLNI